MSSLKDGAMWHDAWKTEYWSQNRMPLIGNGSVNTFPRQQIHMQQ
jgi:hypothetical protein